MLLLCLPALLPLLTDAPAQAQSQLTVFSSLDQRVGSPAPTTRIYGTMSQTDYHAGDWKVLSANVLIR